MADHLQDLRDDGKVQRRPTLATVIWSARYILAATLAWLVAEFMGVFDRRPGNTFTEVTRWLMAAHPLAAWALAAAWVALCVWLVPHFLLTGVDGRWLVWLLVVCILAALGTYGLLSTGLLGPVR